MGFTRYIEILNKMRRTQTTRQQKAKVIYMGLVARKHVFVACQQQWHKPVCASDQHFCYSLIRKYNMLTSLLQNFNILASLITGPIAQLVASPPADQRVVSSIRAHTFVKIDHEIISTIILLLQRIQEGLLSVTSKKYVHKVLVNHLVLLLLWEDLKDRIPCDVAHN